MNGSYIWTIKYGPIKLRIKKYYSKFIFVQQKLFPFETTDWILTIGRLISFAFVSLDVFLVFCLMLHRRSSLTSHQLYHHQKYHLETQIINIKGMDRNKKTHWSSFQGQPLSIVDPCSNNFQPAPFSFLLKMIQHLLVGSIPWIKYDQVNMAWFPGRHEDTNRYKISISFRSTVGKTTGTIGNNLSEQYLPDFYSKIFKIVPIELPNICHIDWISIFKITVYVSVSFSSIEIRSLSLSSVNSNIVQSIVRKYAISCIFLQHIIRLILYGPYHMVHMWYKYMIYNIWFIFYKSRYHLF